MPNLFFISIIQSGPIYKKLSVLGCRAMDLEDLDLIFCCVTGILQAGFLLRLLLCCSGPRIPWQTLSSWWHAADFQVDPRLTKDLDLLRCRMTCRVWHVASFLSMGRVLLQQQRLAFGLLGTSRLLGEFDFLTILGMAMGLVLLWRPSVIRPQTLDAWYVATSLISIVALIPVVHTDARDVLNLTFGFRIFFAVLTKRNWCWMICTAAASTQVLWIAKQQGISMMSGFLGPVLFVSFGVPYLCILAGRWLVYDNIMLRAGLQQKAMELGAVSSLLLVCYDAVVQVDEALNFTEDSSQLSGLLLQTGISHGGLTGKSFLELFDPEDRGRIAQHFANSILEDAPIMATNADMLDSDQNHIKVELLHAQFRDHANERCFLIGVREAQTASQLDDLAPLRNSKRHGAAWCRDDSMLLPDDLDLQVMFEVPSFEVLTLSQDLQRLCESMGRPRPAKILDISSAQSRDAFNANLQELVNEMGTDMSESDGHVMLSLNLMGLGEAQSSFQMKHDEVSDNFVGTLHIKLPLVSPRSGINNSLQSVQVGAPNGTDSRRPNIVRIVVFWGLNFEPPKHRCCQLQFHNLRGTIIEICFMSEANLLDSIFAR